VIEAVNWPIVATRLACASAMCAYVVTGMFVLPRLLKKGR
jgi:hypothetical protein